MIAILLFQSRMDRQPMSSASSLYQSVINDVIGSVRESFLDESVDENVLLELRNLWQQKLDASRAVETPYSDAGGLGMPVQSSFSFNILIFHFLS